MAFEPAPDRDVRKSTSRPGPCISAEIASGQFTARGADGTGTIVTFSAPSSATRLLGTWSATSGRTGTFALTKS
jgi:hypothetical protein